MENKINDLNDKLSKCIYYIKLCIDMNEAESNVGKTMIKRAKNIRVDQNLFYSNTKYWYDKYYIKMINFINMNDDIDINTDIKNDIKNDNDINTDKILIALRSIMDKLNEDIKNYYESINCNKILN